MKELGGYLPLELRKGREYYETCPEYEVRRYNSGRSAILQAVRDSGAKCVWLPVYLCPSVRDMLRTENISVNYYNIGRDFMPVNVQAGSYDIVLYVNYFGITPVKNVGRAIIDNTQAFYSAPVKDAYNVYSCRKFLGVPDGGYLISNKFMREDDALPESTSYGTALYLLKAIDTSTNEAYRGSLDNEDRIEREGVRTMSRLTRAILESVDYEDQKRIRRENYAELCGLLNGINELPPPHLGNLPYSYPLLIRDEGLRAHLVGNHIYVPQWWKAVIDDPLANEWEKYISKYLLPLPVDHRYTGEDMNYIAEMIKNYLNSRLIN